MAQPRRSKKAGIPNRQVNPNLAKSVQQPAPNPRPTAYDYRDELQGMLGWTDDELRQLPLYCGGELAVGEVYLDLNHPERGEFRATSQATVDPGCRYVRKRSVPEDLWYRLATSIGQDELLAGNAAPNPGAFGEPNPNEIATSHGGSGSTSLGEEALEVEEEMD